MLRRSWRLRGCWSPASALQLRSRPRDHRTPAVRRRQFRGHRAMTARTATPEKTAVPIRARTGRTAKTTARPGATRIIATKLRRPRPRLRTRPRRPRVRPRLPRTHPRRRRRRQPRMAEARARRVRQRVLQPPLPRRPGRPSAHPRCPRKRDFRRNLRNRRRVCVRRASPREPTLASSRSPASRHGPSRSSALRYFHPACCCAGSATS